MNATPPEIDLHRLLLEISRAHFPNPPASPEQVAAFERSAGWRLDPELRAFYLHCDGADLFQKPDSPYRLLPLSRIVRVRQAILGRDTDEAGPAAWYALCDVGDSDYVAVDTSRAENGLYPLLDCFHETFTEPGSCTRIASSFSEFLQRALSSGGRLYWLGA
jgi:hypothetical protein